MATEGAVAPAWAAELVAKWRKKAQAIREELAFDADRVSYVEEQRRRERWAALHSCANELEGATFRRSGPRED